MRVFCFLVLSFALSGCASEIQKRTSQNYTLIGMQAQARGDWDTARRAYARAVVNAEHAKLSPNTRALLTYEYGRSLGVNCFYDLAESELNLAYKLDKEAGNPLYLSLTELARLTFDQQKFQSSIIYFEQSIKELDQAKFTEKAPTGYADILDEYSIALFNVDRKADSAAIKKRSIEIRNANPNGKSITDRTPYGKFCVTKEQRSL
jgi:tetratricopeptide (TPR) repeat protein